MRRLVVVGLMVVLLGTATLVAALDQPTSFDAKRAHIYENAGQALTQSSSATAQAIVAQFLRAQGVNAATVSSLYAVSQHRSPVTGLTHVYLKQRVAGLRVSGAYVKAAINAQGELVHLIQNIASLTAPGLTPAKANQRQALRAALANLYPGIKEDPAPVGAADANTTLFAKSAFFHDSPRVERVAVLMDSGELQAGFLVETWKESGNLLHETVVGGTGQVLKVVLRTNSDSYNVFTEDPSKGTQTIVNGPLAGDPSSPAGWLFAGMQNSINITGNNVHAYLDAMPNNRPDRGGRSINDGNFLTVADLSSSPSTNGNREVAVQNLFYLNNVIHDVLYKHGFTETAGNFQEDNFGNGGLGGDSVNAEAEDGGGTDNANFATPQDGRNPRMQMYLWTGRGVYQVAVGTATYMAVVADFGPKPDATGISGSITPVDDGAGTSDTDGCEAFTGFSGKIALIDRGNCNFVSKARNAQMAGAVAVIIVNNAIGPAVGMGDDGTGSDIVIPTVMISQADGTTLNALKLPLSGTVRLTDPPPLQRDGDVDSDVVYHEYGHGLTWRMIGSMGGPMSGAVGEGMSDVLSVILNDDDAVGEYVFNDPIGIRTVPYGSFTRTYSSVTGAEVHYDGEVYGAIGWRLYQNFLGARSNKDELLDYIVDGMNFTPPAPAFEDMRDGILQSIANAGSGRECLVWEAFAHFGVGVGASGQVVTSRGSTTVVVAQSFDTPKGCK